MTEILLYGTLSVNTNKQNRSASVSETMRMGSLTQSSLIEYEPRREKTCFAGFRPA